MQAFTLDDLRNHPEAVLKEARAGHVSLVQDASGSGFVTVPLDETLMKSGVVFAIAVRLYQDGSVSGGVAGKLCGMTLFDFYDAMTANGYPIVNYDPAELDEELRNLG